MTLYIAERNSLASSRFTNRICELADFDSCDIAVAIFAHAQFAISKRNAACRTLWNGLHANPVIESMMSSFP